MRVPDALRVRVGLEVRQSLKTYSTDRARLLAAIYVPRLRTAFQMVDEKNFSRQQAKALVLSCFHDLCSVVESGYLPFSAEPELEIAEQAGLAAECIRQAEIDIATRNFSGSLVRTTTDLCASQGISFPDLPQAVCHDLLEGVGRAIIEQQKLFVLRLGDRLAPFAPADPLFRCAINCTEPGPSKPSIGPTVKDAVSSYLNQGFTRWTNKTHAGRTRQLRYFQEHFGSDAQLDAISAADVRAYRDAIKCLRSNHHRNGATSFIGRQTDNEEHRISAKTAALLFEGAKAFLGWATDVEGYLAAMSYCSCQNVPHTIKSRCNIVRLSTG